MTSVRATTLRTVVRVTKRLGGDTPTSVLVRTSPTYRVRVSLSGFRPISELLTSVVFTFEGGGRPVAQGFYLDANDVPFNCRIAGWTLTADKPTQAQIAIGMASLASYPNFLDIGDDPLLANVIKASGIMSDMTGNIAQGQMLRATILNNTEAERLSLSLRLVRLSS